jgi:Zn-dependent peptidase ImmA (M78 family)/transcriptional regulator with XRE-family HTH domain
MDLSILSANLKRFRAAKARTQNEIAEAAGLSLTGYRNIEDGASAPRVDSLMRVAAVLGVRLEALFVAPKELKAVRFRRDERMSSRDDILHHVGRWLASYNDLEDLLAERKPLLLGRALDDLPVKLKGMERARRLAPAVRKQMGLRDDELIRDIAGLLEHHGIKFLPIRYAVEGFFGLSVGAESGGPAVVINVWERIPVERRIFTAAHELGHLLLHPEDFDVDETAEKSPKEREADEFGSHFLMPDETFSKEWADACGLSYVQRVLKVKAIFRVSWQAVVYRYQRTRPEAEREDLWLKFYRDFEAELGKPLRKTEEPPSAGGSSLSAEEPEQVSAFGLRQDRLERLVRQALDAEKITLSRAAEILDLKLADMRKLASSWVE